MTTQSNVTVGCEAICPRHGHNEAGAESEPRVGMKRCSQIPQLATLPIYTGNYSAKRYLFQTYVLRLRVLLCPICFG